MNDHKQREHKESLWNISACLFLFGAIEQEQTIKKKTPPPPGSHLKKKN